MSKGNGNVNPPLGDDPVGESKSVNPASVLDKREEDDKQRKLDLTLAEVNTIKEELQALIEDLRQQKPASELNQAAIAKGIHEAAMAAGKDLFPSEVNDIDDVIENGEIFFTYSAFYVISHDRRAGRNVFPPKVGTEATDDPNINLIVFNSAASHKIQHGKQEEVVQIATFTSYSKKLSEWLRKHSLYGSEFFDYKEYSNVNLTMGNIEYARRMSQIIHMLSVKHAPELARECQSWMIVPNQDRDIMISTLAQKMVEREFTKDSHGNWTSVRSRFTSQSIAQTISKDEIMDARDLNVEMKGIVGNPYAGNEAGLMTRVDHAHSTLPLK